jgi:hypothetical protein
MKFEKRVVGNSQTRLGVVKTETSFLVEGQLVSLPHELVHSVAGCDSLSKNKNAV